MSLLEMYLRAPDADTLHILKFVLGLTLVLHLPFLGMLVGSTLLSVVFNLLGLSDKRAYLRLLAKDLIETFAPNKGVVFALGILPIPVIILIYAQILYKVENSSVVWLGIGAIFTFLSCVLLYFYKHTFELSDDNAWFQNYAGVLGLGLLLTGVYHYFAASSLLLYPEKWKLITDPSFMLFTSNSLIRFVLFLLASVGITCVAALYILFRWPDERPEHDEVYTKLCTYLLGGLALLTSLKLGAFFLWDSIMIPTHAKDEMALATYVIGAALAMIIGQLMVSNLFKGEPTMVGLALFVYVLFFVNYAVLDYATREFAIQGYTALLETEAAENALLIEEELAARQVAEEEAIKNRHALPEGYSPESIKQGKKLSDMSPEDLAQAAEAADAAAEEAKAAEKAAASGNVSTAALVKQGMKLYNVKGCASCHSVDGSKLVGPSFKNLWGDRHNVVEDGQTKEIIVDMEYLTRSVTYPNAQVVEGYPAIMPAQQLTDAEFNALAAYLKSISENVTEESDAPAAPAEAEPTAPADDHGASAAPAEKSVETASAPAAADVEDSDASV